MRRNLNYLHCFKIYILTKVWWKLWNFIYRWLYRNGNAKKIIYSRLWNKYLSHHGGFAHQSYHDKFKCKEINLCCLKKSSTTKRSPIGNSRSLRKKSLWEQTRVSLDSKKGKKKKGKNIGWRWFYTQQSCYTRQVCKRFFPQGISYVPLVLKKKLQTFYKFFLIFEIKNIYRSINL